MHNRDKILIALAVIISLGILCSQRGDFVLAAPGTSEGAFDRNFNVSGPVKLAIENSSGSVNIHRGGASAVEIHARIKSNNWFGGDVTDLIKKIEQNPPLEQQGNTVRISRPEPHDMFNHVSISYDISVPEETNVESSTGSGSQTVDGVKGPVNVRSGSGSVKLSNIGAAVEARTGSGSVTLDQVNGNADLQTGSGSIRAEGVNGGSKLRAGSGGIDLRQTAPGDVDAETGSGHIHLQGVIGSLTAHAGSGGIEVDGRPKGEWQLHSGSGSIDARTGDAGLDLYARSSSGSVNVESPITMETSSNNRHEVRGKVRGGGTRFEATTGSGSIHVQ
jgi:Putative adhesin